MLGEIILGVVIITLIVERFLYSKEMNRQVRELSKLVKSKDVIEYIATQVRDEPIAQKIESEFVPIENVSDDEFFENIRKQNAG